MKFAHKWKNIGAWIMKRLGMLGWDCDLNWGSGWFSRQVHEDKGWAIAGLDKCRWTTPAIEAWAPQKVKVLKVQFIGWGVRCSVCVWKYSLEWNVHLLSHRVFAALFYGQPPKNSLSYLNTNPSFPRCYLQVDQAKCPTMSVITWQHFSNLTCKHNLCILSHILSQPYIINELTAIIYTDCIHVSRISYLQFQMSPSKRAL